MYILTNKNYTVLYTGVTGNLVKRIYEHKQKLVTGFSSKYNVGTLVWYELHPTMESAILCEKKIKKWKQKWKLNKILEINPEWNDLYQQIT